MRLIVYTSILSISFGVYKIVETNIVLPFVLTGYFEDLIAIPLILGVSTLLIRQFDGRFRITLINALVVWLLFSVHFEWIMPQIDTRFTSDMLDVAMYGFGTLAFMLIQPYLLANYVPQQSEKS